MFFQRQREVGRARLELATNAYKDISVSDKAAHDLVIWSVDAGGYANSYITDLSNEWRSPTHLALEEHSIWSLFNAFTEVLKDGSLVELPKRTQALHGLLDYAVGLN